MNATMLSWPYALALGCSLLLYFVIRPVVIYYRDEKRLRRFPNLSPLSGISSIPMMILAHGGERSTHLTELHKKHPVIRVAPNVLSYGDVRAIKDIYGHNTPCVKDPSYVHLSGSHYHLADVIDRGDHGRKRKVLSAAYALKNLESWEHKVADKVVRLNGHLDKCCTTPLPSMQQTPIAEDVNVDLRAWINFFTLDAISDIGLSQSTGMLDKGHSRVTARATSGKTYETDMRDCLYEMARKQSMLIWPYEWYPFINKVADIIPFYGRMGRLHREWEGIPIELSTQRLHRYQKGEELDDFFQALMQDKAGKPNNLEWGEIIAEVSIMLNAGSVTTAIAIANVMYQFLKNPGALRKARAELDAVFEDYQKGSSADSGTFDEGVLPYDRVKYLPYLRACLDESLRLFPPTVHGLLRSTPAEGMRIMDDFIPGGVSVMMSALTAHRDDKIFPEPDKFVPERWLADNESAGGLGGGGGKNLQPFFLAFSAGARGCIGRNISYLEQAVVVATLLRRYEFALPSPEWTLQRSETLNWILGEMPVKVWRRRNSKVPNE